jgi:hypothetical protein
MLIFTSFLLSSSENSWAVNCTPWSVLKISGLELHRALLKASTQNLESSVLDSSQERT